MFGFLSGVGQRLTGIACLAAAVSCGRADLPNNPPPDLGQLPSFELVAQSGRPYGSQQLRGKVWIANFIFTRCPTVCPVFTEKMAGIQRRGRVLGPDLKLVSFSVDPDYDTPEVLAEYAERFGADPTTWYFLTGTPEQVRITVRDGLKIAMDSAGIVGDVPDIIHGTHFVLIDQQQRIRGYYDSDDPARIEQAVRDAHYLITHKD